jgi:hypothetical protein
MNIITNYFTGLVFIVMICSNIANGQDLEKVMQSYVSKLGGRTKLDSVKSIKGAGKTIFKHSDDKDDILVFTEYKKRPSQYRYELINKRGAIISCSDDKWMQLVDTSYSKKPVKDKESKYSVGFLNSLLESQRYNYELNLLGIIKVRGQDCYEISVKKGAEDQDVYYISLSDYFLILKEECTPSFKIRKYYSDYRLVNDIFFAFKIETETLPYSSVMMYEYIILNQPMNKIIFRYKNE